MTAERAPDPMDALMSGNVTKAVEDYAELLAKAVEQGDITLVSDLFMQLESSIAESKGGQAPTAVEDDAEKVLRDALRRRSASEIRTSSAVDKIIADGKALARESFKRARKRAQRSFEDIERSNAERWRDE